MKRLFTLTTIFTLAFSINTFALPQYSAETQKLMQEAGIEYNNDWETINQRQTARQKRLTNKSASDTQTRLKSANTASQNNPAVPNQDKDKSWGELRINSSYSDKVYYNPDHGARYDGFDEFRYVWELN